VNLKEILFGSGGVMFVLLSLLEVSKIPINPWSGLAKLIGNALNADVLAEVKQTKKRLDDHIATDDERNANLLRTQILRFNDELVDDRKHTKEHFDEILSIIDEYETYCRTHEDYKNNKCAHAVANISRVYDERLEKRDFL
jgi:hypothetical protein